MKTQEQKQQEAKAYIAKSAQHLFVINEKTYYKIIPFNRDGVLHYAKLMITGDNVSLNIVNLNGYKWDLKQSLFPQYVKTKSTPYFKKMREIVQMVETEIKLTDNQELVDGIKTKIKDLVPTQY